jgi:hypothetical protein
MGFRSTDCSWLSVLSAVVVVEVVSEVGDDHDQQDRDGGADHDQATLGLIEPAEPQPRSDARPGRGRCRLAGGGAAQEPTARAGFAGKARQFSRREHQPQPHGELGGEVIVLGVLAQMARRVGATDRVRLAEQIVGEADVSVRVGAHQLGERGPSPSAHGGLVLAEQGAKVGIALTPLEQKLQRGALILGDHAPGTLRVGACALAASGARR